ncbi:MAG TPA: carbonic anhydrase [Thermoanaerobaculia bacterium]|jgi:carbonic anhydrase|nr:carbonic anhydrase [Thermoanaerobaculia bacterium]
MRQSRIVLAALLVLALVLPLAAQEQLPSRLHEPFSVDSLWSQLTTGNGAYEAGALRFTEINKARERTAGKQEPPVTVLSCADSRVPPELVFYQGIGELFVVRVAGNVADTFGIASIEYAIAHHWTKMIVVLGHERCGAVIEALKDVEPGTPALIALVHRIRESFTKLPPGKKDDAARIRAAVIANAKASADYLVENSDVIGKAVRSGDVGVVVAYYPMVKRDGIGKVERIPWKIPPPK